MILPAEQNSNEEPEFGMPNWSLCHIKCVVYKKYRQTNTLNSSVSYL